jgi:hypothetical protein
VFVSGSITATPPLPTSRSDRRKAMVKRTVGPAIYSVMQPGEQIRAGVLAGTSPPGQAAMVAVAVAAGLATVGFGTVGILGSGWNGIPLPLLAMASVLSSGALALGRKVVFVAVTDRQVICWRLGDAASYRPYRLVLSTPLTDASIGRARYWRPWHASVVVGSPAMTSRRGLRLDVDKRWFKDLDEVLAAMPL